MGKEDNGCMNGIHEFTIIYSVFETGCWNFISSRIMKIKMCWTSKGGASFKDFAENSQAFHKIATNRREGKKQLQLNF